MSDAYKLRDYIGYVNENQVSDEELESTWETAGLMIAHELTGARLFGPIPADVMERMQLEVGNALLDRKKSPAATAELVQYDGGAVPIRISRDPLYQIRPILRMYVSPF